MDKQVIISLLVDFDLFLVHPKNHFSHSFWSDKENEENEKKRKPRKENRNCSSGVYWRERKTEKFRTQQKVSAEKKVKRRRN